MLENPEIVLIARMHNHYFFQNLIQNSCKTE
jgi:hypothetical protein